MSRESDDVRQLSVDEVLEAVSVARPSSGAGIAAALALALAAACGRKAAGVTLKRKEAADLQEIDEHLALLQHRAVSHAQRDQLLFKAFLETRQPLQAQNLVESSQLFQQLVADVGREIDRLAPLVNDSVAGDVDAARSLHRAAADVAATLLREARRSRSRSV